MGNQGSLKCRSCQHCMVEMLSLGPSSDTCKVFMSNCFRFRKAATVNGETVLVPCGEFLEKNRGTPGGYDY